jgi:hypothetical protein
MRKKGLASHISDSVSLLSVTIFISLFFFFFFRKKVKQLYNHRYKKEESFKKKSDYRNHRTECDSVHILPEHKYSTNTGGTYEMTNT